MNRKLVATSIVIALIGGPVLAETDPVAEIDRQWAERAKVQAKMATHIEMMRSTMSKLQASDDPQARKTLMNEHMQEMRQMMGMMTATPGMHGPMHGVGSKDLAPTCLDDSNLCRQVNAMAKRHAYIEREIAMMQMMMQQMMEHSASETDQGKHRQK